MKASELKAGVWYKFFPYRNELSWYFRPLYDGKFNEAIDYITCGPNREYHRGGSFLDYSEESRAYQEALPEEVNPFVPEGCKIPTSPNYQIY